MKILLAVILGGFFGFALYIVGATTNSKIIKMLRLEDMTLAKIILFAIGFSSVLLSITAMTGIFDISHLNVKTMNLGVVIGGIIFGFGFGNIGTCPGTCVGALGGKNGIKRSITTVIGGLTGAFAFSMTYDFFKTLGLFRKLNYGTLSLFSISDKFESVFNIGFVGLFVLGIIFIAGSYFMPQKLIKDNQ